MSLWGQAAEECPLGYRVLYMHAQHGWQEEVTVAPLLFLASWVTLPWSFCAQLLGGASVHSHFKSKASAHSVSVSWLPLPSSQESKCREGETVKRKEWNSRVYTELTLVPANLSPTEFFTEVVLFLSGLSCVQ